MAEIPVRFLLEKLGTFLAKEMQLLGGMGKEIKDIKDELESIQAFLKDADRMKHRCEGIKAWVNQVRRVAYDVEDAIDEFVLRFGPRNDGGGIMNNFTTLFSATKQLHPSHHLAHSIKSIKGSIATISERKDRYNIKQMIEAAQSSDADTRQWQGQKEAKLLEEAAVVGMESQVEDLMNQLVARTGNDRKTFISVYGMPGVGKSTLARKVYEDLKSKKHFNCFAWLSVSQSFNTKDLLKFMLIEFGNIREQNSSKKAKENTLPSKKYMEKMGEADLKDRVQKYLEGKRFILVLDDVWDKNVCIDINLALPENSNGSKIVITTRIQSLASELEGTENINTNSYELKPLGDEAATELLYRKAFPGCAVPWKFEDVCKSMLQRCGGLPLAIVALGGILRQKKTREEWEMVNNHLSEQLANYELSSKGTNIRSILKLSYDELPFHLKPCFLYCALFPEDHLIKRNKLIRLWVAEGFIKEIDGETEEKVGEEWLMQLIGRSMLQVEDTNFDGSRVRSCRLHCLMRGLAISISQEEEFSSKLDKQGRNENVIKPRRMSVIGDSKENGIASIADTQLRSLLFFNVRKGRTPEPNLYSKFKLLRVLDLENVGINKLPEQIAQLLHLRYLSLYRNYHLKHLPGSIGCLEKLETLDIRRTGIDELPDGIVRLKKLRHLCMRLHTQVPKGISKLSCLQTFIGVTCSEKGIGAEIGVLKELRRLTVSVVKEEDAEELYAAISGLTHLFRLRIQPAPSNLTLPFGKTSLIGHPPPRLRILTLGGFSELPNSFGSFNNLIRLTLGEGSFKEDPLPPLSSIPSLLYLDLRGLDNVEGLHCAPRRFPELQSLELYDMGGLKTVTLKEGSMPSLKRLVIYNCPKLQMAPQGIQHLKLQELLLHNMPDDFIARLKEGGEDRSKVQHIPFIRVSASTNSTPQTPRARAV